MPEWVRIVANHIVLPLAGYTSPMAEPGPIAGPEIGFDAWRAR